jgi:hypothetical protein
MKSIKHVMTGAVFSAIAAAALSSSALAAEDTQTPSVAIEKATQNGHAYQNGGVTRDDVAKMEHQMKPYNVRLMFSEGKFNDYVTGLQLKITRDKGQQVFALNDAGPLTDVALPAGTYHVTADFGGVKRSGTVVVKPGESAMLNLHWPKDET